ncbi:hypothetical protein [Thermasporomyces composti]|nr:hypothetical protein [Thermasporomyces composti]
MTTHRPRAGDPPGHSPGVELAGSHRPLDAVAHREAVVERLRHEAADDMRRWPDPHERHDQWAARTFGATVPPAEAYEFWLRIAGVPEEHLHDEAKRLAEEVARRRETVLGKVSWSTRQ